MISSTSSEHKKVAPNQKPFVPQVPTNTNKGYLMCKRIMDLTLAILAIIALTPLFVVIGVVIKLEDRKGPVIFKQVRVGENGKEFNMYKFRSMVTNAEQLKENLLEQNETTGPVFKIKHDPRITKVGRFIRKTSMDELPQLFNVVKGEMSLVGPRPPIPKEVAQYSSYEWQRLSVVPGLTCYWQVSGRSTIGFSEWMRLDMQYIQDRSFLIDIKLIVKTIVVLFGSKDAY